MSLQQILWDIKAAKVISCPFRGSSPEETEKRFVIFWRKKNLCTCSTSLKSSLHQNHWISASDGRMHVCVTAFQRPQQHLLSCTTLFDVWKRACLPNSKSHQAAIRSAGAGKLTWSQSRSFCHSPAPLDRGSNLRPVWFLLRSLRWKENSRGHCERYLNGSVFTENTHGSTRVGKRNRKLHNRGNVVSKRIWGILL